ncbi:MAG: GNAT family N-acetyltransferase [Snowella sp.]|nr:GNAT family N-acetyltransferase [Snowella sp.]
MDFLSSDRIRQGSSKDRPHLINFMNLAYQELFPNQRDFNHLIQTVNQYFSSETPLWWVEAEGNLSPTPALILPIAGLWMGNAIDQITGDRYAHIFLLYVVPEYRRRGIAKALLQQAQDWATARGDRQIGLHVFPQNQAAINLYQQFGFQTQSIAMLKKINS